MKNYLLKRVGFLTVAVLGIACSQGQPNSEVVTAEGRANRVDPTKVLPAMIQTCLFVTQNVPGTSLAAFVPASDAAPRLMSATGEEIVSSATSLVPQEFIQACSVASRYFTTEVVMADEGGEIARIWARAPGTADPLLTNNRLPRLGLPEAALVASFRPDRVPSISSVYLTPPPKQRVAFFDDASGLAQSVKDLLDAAGRGASIVISHRGNLSLSLQGFPLSGETQQSIDGAISAADNRLTNTWSPGVFRLAGTFRNDQTPDGLTYHQMFRLLFGKTFGDAAAHALGVDQEGRAPAQAVTPANINAAASLDQALLSIRQASDDFVFAQVASGIKQVLKELDVTVPEERAFLIAMLDPSWDPLAPQTSTVCKAPVYDIHGNAVRISIDPKKQVQGGVAGTLPGNLGFQEDASKRDGTSYEYGCIYSPDEKGPVLIEVCPRPIAEPPGLFQLAGGEGYIFANGTWLGIPITNDGQPGLYSILLNPINRGIGAKYSVNGPVIGIYVEKTDSVTCAVGNDGHPSWVLTPKPVVQWLGDVFSNSVPKIIKDWMQ